MHTAMTDGDVTTIVSQNVRGRDDNLLDSSLERVIFSLRYNNTAGVILRFFWGGVSLGSLRFLSTEQLTSLVFFLVGIAEEKEPASAQNEDRTTSWQQHVKTYLPQKVERLKALTNLSTIFSYLDRLFLTRASIFKRNSGKWAKSKTPNKRDI